MTVAISVNNLEKVYASGVVALKCVSLQVQQGDFFALLGPNGAGKSTFIGILSTLVTRSNGDVQIFGRDVDTHVYRTKLDLGVVPQEINFSQFEKVADIVMTQAGYYGLPRKLAAQRTEKYLKQLGLWEKRDVRSRLLSGGMKRRMMIARALVHEPRLLILDEPTAGVDIELRRSMWDFLLEINEAGTTIVLTTHYLEEAEQLCRNIAIIDEGRIIEDTSMKKLLLELDTHAYILDAEADFDRDLQHDEPGLSLHKVDSHSIEAVLSGGRDINSAIAVLDRLGIRIVSMRNKANRLEQLFLSRLRASENGGS
ncbi:MAG: ABC transporter ATP-binding protein [Gammaproteobacteria bacterium]|nr:ABC transporter ATP-binding protein [Gammaproteobacteria bacterium]